MELLSYIARQLEATPDTLLGGIQSTPSFLKAFCKLTLTPGITERSEAVGFTKRYAMRTARASAIWRGSRRSTAGAICCTTSVSTSPRARRYNADRFLRSKEDNCGL
jgi:hypothetical protein